MINKIWGFFIISGIIYSLFTGNINIINKEILESSTSSFNLMVQMFTVLSLWLGIMKIAEVSGLLKKLSSKLSKILKFIFPEIPKNHESLSLIASNIIANMAGLGSAATPFGLKAMDELQKLNKKKDTASCSMITFLVLNTSGVTIIPTTIISLRMLYKSIDPTKIVLPCILATMCSTIAGLIMDRFLARRFK